MGQLMNSLCQIISLHFTCGEENFAKKWIVYKCLVQDCRLIWICKILVILTFFCFRTKITFLGKFSPKNQNCQFILKFVTRTNSNRQNSIVMFSLSVADWNYLFWANLVQKIKVVHFNWNSIPRLIQICRIQWRG